LPPLLIAFTCGDTLSGTRIRVCACPEGHPWVLLVSTLPACAPGAALGWGNGSAAEAQPKLRAGAVDSSGKNLTFQCALL